MIELIISNENLRLEEEDELLNLLLKIYSNDQSISYMFEYVNFNNVKEKTLKKFVDSVTFDDLTKGTWDSFCIRLFPSYQLNENKRKYEKEKKDRFIIEKTYKEGDEFNGIMKYLYNKINGNIHDKGVVEISSNSVYLNNYPKNVVDYQTNNFYDSLINQENATICFDFKDKKVQLSRYSIKTGSFTCHLKNWVIEVSNDGKTWEQVDEHSNDSTLNKNDRIATFVTKQSSEFYRFIQLRQTGKNWSGGYEFQIKCIEFYGKLLN